MYKIAAIFGFIFLFSAPSFAQLEWFGIQNLSNEYGPAKDHNMVNNGEQYFLVWDQWGDIKFRKSVNGGTNWGNKITLYSAFDYGGNYPVVAASQGKVYVAYFRNTTGNSQIFMVKSDNNGQSFGNEIQVTNAINQAQTPQIAASGDTVVIAYEDRDASWNYQIYVMTSVDGGQSWSGPINVSNTSGHARWCNLVMRNDALYVVWNDQTGPNYDDLDLFFSRSENFGTSWTSPFNISNNQAYNARLNTTVVDNNIYVVVSSKIDGLQTDIMLYRSEDLGDTWSAPLNLSDNSGNSSRPDIWVVPNYADNHRIYVVWTDKTYHANERAYIRYSVDNGYSWSDEESFSQSTEDAGWAQIGGHQGSSSDHLFVSWFRPHEGTFDYEVWGRRAEHQLAANVNLSGYITNTNDEPIAQATVALNGFVVFSETDGHYSLDVPAGTYDFTVSAPAYQNYGINQLEINEDMLLDVTLEALVPGHYPPHNLHAELQEVENILVSWEPPIGFGSIELAWDNGEANGMFWPGSATGDEFMAVGFEHDQAFYLRQLKLFSQTDQTDESMLVYVFGDDNGVPDRDIILGGPFLVDVENGWTTVAVDIPIPPNVRFYIASQWNSGNTYKIGGDLSQPDGYSYSSINDGIDWYVHDDMDFMIRAGIAFDDRTLQDQLMGYQVYLNDEPVGEPSQETHYLIEEVAVDETHLIGVSALYEEGESPQATLQIHIPVPLLFPPLNLQADIVDHNVLLNWDEPATEGEWMHWDSGQNADAVGGENIEVFDAAVRFTTTDLQAYNGHYLTKVTAFIADADCQVYLRVWQGGNQNYAGPLVYEQELINPEADSWNIVELQEPVLIDATQELWFGYRIINPAGVYPAGTDNGPAVPFKGDMLLYGPDWVSMYNQFGWNINWNIQGFVVDPQGNEKTPGILTPLPNEPIIFSGEPELIAAGRNTEVFRWSYGHFNVYRNEELIGTSPEGVFSYTDENPLNENLYYVTTAWGNFESAPSNSVMANLVSLHTGDDKTFGLQVSPNPASEYISIRFNLPRADHISLIISDLSGKQMRLIDEQYFEQGIHIIPFNRKDFSPLAARGMMLIQLHTKESVQTKRLLLLE